MYVLQVTNGSDNVFNCVLTLLKSKLLITIDFVHCRLCSYIRTYVNDQVYVCICAYVHVHSPVMNNDKGIFTTQYVLVGVCAI